MQNLRETPNCTRGNGINLEDLRIYYNRCLPETQGRNHMQCRKCHSEAPDRANFCPKCGAKLVVAHGVKSRGNGQGTAFKRGKTWTAKWSLPAYIDENGKLHQPRKTKGGFQTKKAALAYASCPPDSVVNAPTLRAYHKTWHNAGFTKLSKSKQIAYDIAWKRWAGLYDKPVSNISIGDLQGQVDAETSTYYPAKDMKTLVSHLLKMAVAEGYMRSNLAEFIELPPLNEKELTPYTEDEIKLFWAAYTAGDTFIGYILLMIYTGMMPGELFILKKDMIDFDKCEIRGAGLKTKKRKETALVFPQSIGPVLHKLCDYSRSRKDYVLCMDRDKFYPEYHRAVQSAGCRDLPPYSCRHTTATALALGNIAPSVIQEVMRHTKFTTTQRYIHPDNAASHAAINQIVTSAE